MYMVPVGPELDVYIYTYIYIYSSSSPERRGRIGMLHGGVGALPHSNPLDEPAHIQAWVATILITAQRLVATRGGLGDPSPKVSTVRVSREVQQRLQTKMVAMHLKVITVRVQFAPTCKRQGELVYWLAS
jgi:hypothetical protein